jgi:hypothetical protein
MSNQWEGSGGIGEFRLSNPPPVLAATVYSGLKSNSSALLALSNYFFMKLNMARTN